MATTTVPPPTYVAGDSPPSYEEVANKVNQLVGSDATPQKYLDVATSLSEEERKVLSDGAEPNNPIKTEDDKRKLSLGAAKTMSKEDTVAKMQEDASAAGKAVVAIDTSFTALQVKIAEIDQLEQTNFLVLLNDNKTKYNAVLTTSRTLAADISQYGSSFDKLIIPLCSDESLTVEQRLEQIEKFIARAEGFRAKSEQINKDFDALVNDFIVFKAQFAQWGQDKQGELRQDIADLLADIGVLNDKLAKLRISLLALGVGLGAGLAAAGIGLALSGPVAPFILIGGLIFAGATAAAVAGIAISMGIIQNEIDAKNQQVKDKNAEINAIDQARTGLETLGDEQFTVFQQNVKVLQSYWTVVQADAEQIKGWLQDGADLANAPSYMQDSLNEAVSIYASLGKYMDAYAKGTTI
ncbi:hypothetical protein CBS63078_8655 [Aspergillus niger]|uniref:Uncharacterized protein n=2 Tax=Aspergillus niger TaxID=5061 RepID=G3XVB4_ASPNA|nr:uncharacterized protein BO96DRAFT_338823 [Aspergillus niger CBS 101883]EHA25167.1 hypothetical protein ASPNIDRAFT_54034 [Aspergillus niger ATCC 1015]KAI2852793.1 hypothetical protein CBS11350_426 [Aspergillus niger]KAI2886467.1 hypothetical protein CBS13152_7109 [Aspergillus niger]KAI2895029.1 hypothetical protein CBS63078_8655 [Aspergillus niger]KAI2919074.1 hypothetical protein CBS147371_3779 [Aspergillus niger]